MMYAADSIVYHYCVLMIFGSSAACLLADFCWLSQSFSRQQQRHQQHTRTQHIHNHMQPKNGILCVCVCCVCRLYINQIVSKFTYSKKNSTQICRCCYMKIYPGVISLKAKSSDIVYITG